MKKIITIAFVIFLVSMNFSIVSATIQMKPGSADILLNGLHCKLTSTIPNIGGKAMISTKLLAIEGGYNIKNESGWEVFYDAGGIPQLKVKADTQKAIGKDGESIELLKPAYLQFGDLFVPAKQVSEILNMSVTWNEKNKEYPLTITKNVITKKVSWADNLIKKIGSEIFFFVSIGLILFFIIAFLILAPLRRKYWGQE